MGLRERKKLRTREALRAHALRLFREQGYEATTLEQVAAAADVSPRTLYRYFPTKEDLVVSDDYDPMLWRLVEARPPDEPPLRAVREALAVAFPMLDAAAVAAVQERTRLMRSTPSLEGRVLAEQMRTAEDLAVALAARRGEQPDLGDRAVAAGAVAALSTAVMAWADAGSGEYLADWVLRALDALAGAGG